MNDAQNHPLYSTDRENLDRLIGIDSPESIDLVELEITNSLSGF